MYCFDIVMAIHTYTHRPKRWRFYVKNSSSEYSVLPILSIVYQFVAFINKQSSKNGYRAFVYKLGLRGQSTVLADSQFLAYVIIRYTWSNDYIGKELTVTKRRRCCL